ncbi:hypothetical protein [Chthonobacter rhizosphaerae]|uniref:hypothetical protein n=1 Tax=Chthonobacter rhizosphaerae TaxID=2735553 RepID=UPI0015EF8BEB|nr:hypothetical protein [Chthonobacter rhizosphaerae]
MTFVGLLAAAPQVLPPAIVAARLVAAADDPARLADLRLSEDLTADRVAAEIDAALADGDDDLAASLLALADDRAVPVDAGRRAAVLAASAGGVLRTARSFAVGAATGAVDDGASLAGALAGDLVGIGDVRDLGREGWKLLDGQEPDVLVAGLSAAGLAVTAATWSSLGAATPARAGLTVLKAAARAGRLSANLAADLARLARRAVDPATLGRALRSGDRAALKAATRADGVAPMLALARDVARLNGRAGAAAVADALKVADDAADLSRAARLADRFGDGTRATLKILGRSALVIGRGLDGLIAWVAAGIGWALTLASASAATGRALARATRPRRRTRTAAPGSRLVRPVAAA